MDNNALVPIVPANEAVATTRIKEIPEIYNPLVVLIGYIHLLRGQKPDTEELVFQASELERELKDNYSYLTLEEVRLALENGVKKRFGDYFGLNVVTYVEWLDAYKKSDARRKALEEYRLKSLPPAPPVDPIRRAKESLLLEYNFWIGKKPFFWCPDPKEAYQYATDAGLISPTKEQKIEAAEKARAKIVNELSAETKKAEIKGDKWTYDNNIVVLKEYREKDISQLLLEKDLLRRYSKKYLLIDYFEELQKAGSDLKTILDLAD